MAPEPEGFAPLGERRRGPAPPLRSPRDEQPGDAIEMIRQVGLCGGDEAPALFAVQRHRDDVEARPHRSDQGAAALVMEIDTVFSILAGVGPAVGVRADEGGGERGKHCPESVDRECGVVARFESDGLGPVEDRLDRLVRNRRDVAQAREPGRELAKLERRSGDGRAGPAAVLARRERADGPKFPGWSA